MPSPKRFATSPPLRSRRSSDPDAVASGILEWSYHSRSAADTDRLGRLVGQCSQRGAIVALYGDLGTGKTVFVRGVAAGLGASPRAVSSPTFVLIHEYQGQWPLAHVDLYRLRNAAELEHVGLSDYLDGRTVVAIEWAEKAGPELPQDRLEIHLSYGEGLSRDILLKATGQCSRGVLTCVKQRGVRRRAAAMAPKTERAR